MRRPSRVLPAVALALSLAACGNEPDSLVVCAISAPAPLPEVDDVLVRAGGVLRAYPTLGKLGPLPIYRGVYVPGDILGEVIVDVEATGRAGCPRYEARGLRTHLSRAGESVTVMAVLAEVSACPPTGSDAGTADAARVDAAIPDARELDAAASDASVVDAPAASDAPTGDAADAGAALDAS